MISSFICIVAYVGVHLFRLDHITLDEILHFAQTFITVGHCGCFDISITGSFGLCAFLVLIMEAQLIPCRMSDVTLKEPSLRDWRATTLTEDLDSVPSSHIM